MESPELMCVASRKLNSRFLVEEIVAIVAGSSDSCRCSWRQFDSMGKSKVERSPELEVELPELICVASQSFFFVFDGGVEV